MPEAVGVGIDGVLRFELEVHADGRGAFLEDYRRGWVPGAREMVQGNLSFSSANVLRGLHVHREQADWWTFVSGSAVVGLYDLRESSPTRGVGLAVPVEAGERFSSLYLPPGVAHGFSAVTDVALHYLVDAYYTGADEFGVAWDDPALGIGWPSTDPILSDRDRSNPSLADVLRDLPPFGVP